MHRLVPVISVALVAVTAAAAADAPEVLVGRSIGAVRLGMTEAAVTAAYGPPRRRTRWHLAGRSGPVAVYRSLQVSLDAGRVVAVETVSPRYRLAGAIGVGTITPPRPNEFSFTWRGFRYDACSGAYRRRAYGAITELVLPVGATTGRRIIAVAIADGAHLLLLPGAGRCD
ncbi:MAG: hypothetical protein ACXWZY_01835 [Gaiellaceae bacterium]